MGCGVCQISILQTKRGIANASKPGINACENDVQLLAYLSFILNGVTSFRSNLEDAPAKARQIKT